MGYLTEQERGFFIEPAEGAAMIKFDACKVGKEFLRKWSQCCMKNSDYWVGQKDNESNYFAFMELKHYRRRPGLPFDPNHEDLTMREVVERIAESIAKKMVCSCISLYILKEYEQDLYASCEKLSGATGCMEKYPRMYFIFATSYPFKDLATRWSNRIFDPKSNKYLRSLMRESSGYLGNILNQMGHERSYEEIRAWIENSGSIKAIDSKKAASENIKQRNDSVKLPSFLKEIKAEIE